MSNLFGITVKDEYYIMCIIYKIEIKLKVNLIKPRITIICSIIRNCTMILFLVLILIHI